MSETVAISVVFTDLVGSTEMSSRLGPEATERLRVVHFGLLRDGMERFGGTEVKNLGDGLMLVFPSLGAALDASVAMQQAIERHNASGKEQLGVRVGIATGDAIKEDNDYFGEPVVEAARLCAKCDAGQIIVSQLLSLVARTSGHTFRSIGDLELLGIAEPVPSMTVNWEPMQIQGAIPIPDRLKIDLDLPLAGRSSERDAMNQAFKEAELGASRLTFLAGEPGIGKTRLSSELAADVHNRGAITLYGRCDEELSLPYQPWVEAVSYLFETGSEELLAESIRLHGPELAKLAPQIRRRFPEVQAPQSTDAETERYLLLQAVTSLLSIIATDQPVLFVLDDLHWAAKPTLTMLRHVYTNMPTSSLMIIGTYRDTDLETGHPLIDTVAALRRESGVEQISVRGLDDIEMVSLVQISAGHELDAAATSLSHSLRQETAGNPFFAHEMLRNLVEVGDVFLDENGQWVFDKSFDELSLPQSIRDVVGQRIARLGEETLKALRSAAVIGKEFQLDLLAAVTNSDEDDLLDLLEGAVGASILAEVSGVEEKFRFIHTVTRNTLQSELSDGRKRRMHRTIAEELERTIGEDPGPRVSELATHWMASAAPVDGSKAIHYARLAGHQAQEALAPDAAIQWFTSALEHLDLADEPDLQVRTEVLVELGTAQQDAGEPAYRQTLLDAGALAESLGDTTSMVNAALANNLGMYSKLGTQDQERIEALESALAATGDAATSQRALLLATLFSELEYRSSFDLRSKLISEAIDIARAVDDPWVLASTLNRSCITSAVPENLEARVSASAESLALAHDLGDLTLEFWALCGRFQAATGASDRDAAESALGALTTAADEICQPSFRWVAGNLKATLLSALGQSAELEETAATNLTVGTDAGEPDAFDYFAIQMMTARWIQGRSVEVLDLLLEAAANNPELEAYVAVAAMFHAEDGDPDEARTLLSAAHARGFESRCNNSWSTCLAAWGVAASELGDADSAAVIYRILAPWSGQFACHQAFVFSPIDSVLGLLATVLERYDQAEIHFAAAEAMATAFGAHFFSAHIDLGRARLHLAGEDPVQTGHYARRAIETAQQGGFESIERRAATCITAIDL